MAYRVRRHRVICREMAFWPQPPLAVWRGKQPLSWCANSGPSCFLLRSSGFGNISDRTFDGSGTSRLARSGRSFIKVESGRAVGHWTTSSITSVTNAAGGGGVNKRTIIARRCKSSPVLAIVLAATVSANETRGRQIARHEVVLMNSSSRTSSDLRCNGRRSRRICCGPPCRSKGVRSPRFSGSSPRRRSPVRFFPCPPQR